MSVGEGKGGPGFARAPHYFTAVADWFDRLSLDQTELVYIVQHIDTTPGYGGEEAAIAHAAGLPPVSAPPEVIRKAWGHG